LERPTATVRQGYPGVGSAENRSGMIEFPEGIELYDLLAAAPGADDVMFVVPASADGPLDWSEGQTTEVIEIRKMRGSLGWTEELRVLVIFDGAPIPVFETSSITDAEISLECASGDRLLRLDAEKDNEPWKNHTERFTDPYDPDSSGY